MPMSMYVCCCDIIFFFFLAASSNRCINIGHPCSEKPPEYSNSEQYCDLKAVVEARVKSDINLSKNKKRKLKKKRRRHLLNHLEIQRAKDFIYSSENEQLYVHYYWLSLDILL